MKAQCSKCMPAHHSAAGRFHFGLFSPEKHFWKAKANNLVTGSWFPTHIIFIRGHCFSFCLECDEERTPTALRAQHEMSNGNHTHRKLPPALKYYIPTLKRLFWKGTSVHPHLKEKVLGNTVLNSMLGQ